ncbi:NAD(P)-binding protein [Tothia fuscella]|uniref:NAD(P)-binding protein n=1 Tax=Tothia fuscella TaxID=1048955 RepID=A0A9P4U404_9PEZI|nr:NAD(P)-binding protein [Tothia fuscella]
MGYILLTGATGNLGAVILQQLLTAGHNVNAVIRSVVKSKDGLSKQYEAESKSGQLVFTEISDMTVSGAFHDSAKDASAIIHAATPLGYDNFLETVIKPVMAITKNVLDAAASSPKVKRVIITGTIVSTLKLPDDLFSGRTISENDWNSTTLEEGVQDKYYAYGYSKVSSEKMAWNYVKKEKPTFELLYLLAPAITGKSIQLDAKLSKEHLGGISGFYSAIFDVESPGGMFPYFMDVEDVAAIHLKALESSVQGNERYLFHSRGVMESNRVANFVRQKFAELRDRVPEGAENVKAPPALVKTDISKAEAAFGSNWKSWEDTVVNMVVDIMNFERAGLIDGLTAGVVQSK